VGRPNKKGRCWGTPRINLEGAEGGEAWEDAQGLSRSALSLRGEKGKMEPLVSGGKLKKSKSTQGSISRNISSRRKTKVGVHRKTDKPRKNWARKFWNRGEKRPRRSKKFLRPVRDIREED